MNRRFHGASHLGRGGIDLPNFYTPVTLRRHLTIWLNTAERKMQLGLQLPTGDMWTRAYEMYKDMSDQIALLDATMGGA